MSVSRQLDLRELPPEKVPSEVLDCFDALEARQAFVLVSAQDPRPILRQLQAERPRRFEWSVLEAGPARHRVEIRRRSGEGPRSVTELLEADHKRLDAIVPLVEQRVNEGTFSEARARFAEFVCGLERHIDLEEQVLFPAFERATGMSGGGPTFVMRGDHVEIRRLMREVEAALESADAGVLDSLHDLVETLSIHNLKEERMLYPMADRAAGDDRARDELVHQLQSY